jgi:hypothetical protein
MTPPIINLDQLEFSRDTRHRAAVDYWHGE